MTGMLTEQMQRWSGEFGREYTERNLLSLEEVDALYRRNYGQTRSGLNDRFLSEIDRTIRVLEVGSNVGNQLLFLQRMEFSALYGIELQSHAVELAKSQTRRINMIEGSVFDIPFRDGFFDLVFTSGLLIHISPSEIGLAMAEIHRCASRYIWGFEYYAEHHVGIEYRGQKGLLWKADFARLYLDQFDDLELIREEHLKYVDGDNVDTMFLLRRRAREPGA